MTDFYWPADGLTPFVAEFYLLPHTGRSQSPFTRQHKLYGLSAPLWKARLQVRGGYDGTSGLEGVGAAMDALLAHLQGGQNRIGFWDFRRPTWPGIDTSNAGNEAASRGDTEITLTDLVPGEWVPAGHYLGGDGRAHIIRQDVEVEGDGTAVVAFQPPLNADLVEDSIVIGKPLTWFRLTSDEAGANATAVGEATVYDLDFIEDPLFAPAEDPVNYLRIGGIIILIGGELVEI